MNPPFVLSRSHVVGCRSRRRRHRERPTCRHREPSPRLNSSRDPDGAAPRILIVDDDPAICLAYSEVLTGVGYEVLTANSRADAMSVLDIVGAGVDVLILDIRLPDADGSAVARDIAERIGQRPTLYVSGWTDDFWDLADAPGRWRVRQKPIPIPWLLDTVKWLAGGAVEPPPG